MILYLSMLPAKWDILLVIHNFRELKNLAINAKIKSYLKFLYSSFIRTAWYT